MSAHVPIGSCCSKPQFNSVGGIDDSARPSKLDHNNLVPGMRKITPIILAAAAAFTTLAVGYVGALLLTGIQDH